MNKTEFNLFLKYNNVWEKMPDYVLSQTEDIIEVNRTYSKEYLIHHICESSPQSKLYNPKREDVNLWDI